MRYAIILGAWNFSVATQTAVCRLCFATEGFEPWAPYDPKLAALIAANGEPSYFGLLSS
jgi:hypothetical protein